MSVNAERSAVGRTAESALAMLSDITKDNDKGVYKIEWREGKTSKTKSIFLCQVSIVHSVVSHSKSFVSRRLWFKHSHMKVWLKHTSGKRRKPPDTEIFTLNPETGGFKNLEILRKYTA